MVVDVIRNSDDKDVIMQSPEYKDELNSLRSFMFANVYKSGRVKREEDLAKVEVVVSSLYKHFMDYPEQMPEDLQKIAEADGRAEAAKDYVAGMTDRFAIAAYTDLFTPRLWK